MSDGRWSVLTTAGFVVVVSISLGWFVLAKNELADGVGSEAGRDAEVAQLDVEPTAATTAAYPTAPITVTLPPGYPTPSFITTEQEAIALAKALLRDKGPWLEEYAARTPRLFLGFWENGHVGPAPLPTVAPDEDPYYAEAIWVVGLRSESPISRERVDAVLGLGDVGSVNSKPWSRFGGYEVYVAFDGVGNLYGAGLVDLPDETGTPRPDPAWWTLEGIEALPTP